MDDNDHSERQSSPWDKPAMTDHMADRLTRCETMLQIALENQDESRDHRNRIGNQLQEVTGRLLSMTQKLEETMHALTFIEGLETRLGSLEDTRTRAATVWQVVKWAAAVTMGFATISMAIGDKLAKFLGMGS